MLEISNPREEGYKSKLEFNIQGPRAFGIEKWLNWEKKTCLYPREGSLWELGKMQTEPDASTWLTYDFKVLYTYSNYPDFNFK